MLSIVSLGRHTTKPQRDASSDSTKLAQPYHRHSQVIRKGEYSVAVRQERVSIEGPVTINRIPRSDRCNRWTTITNLQRTIPQPMNLLI